MTHGGHSKRRIGAIGQRAFSARVHKGHRMPGHMGNQKVTQQNLKVVELRGEKNLLLVRGAIPGPNGAIILVKKSLKKRQASPAACAHVSSDKGKAASSPEAKR